MPKEKKSAASAIRPDGQFFQAQLDDRADRGCPGRTPSRAATSTQHAVGLVPDQVQLHHRPDQRHHDLHLRVPARLDPSRRRPRPPPGPASRTARARSTPAGHRAARASGWTRAAAPTAASSRSLGGPFLTGGPWPRPPFTANSVRSGRNSCSGGSSNRTVTGSPSMASNSATKSSRCNGSSASSADLRVCASWASTSRSTSTRRSPRNMCSVRHSPMPCAPRRRARAASSALSAFARTRSRRVASAWPRITSTAPHQVSRLGVSCSVGVRDDRVEALLQVARRPVSSSPARRRGTPHRSTPSSAITSPSAMTTLRPSGVATRAVRATRRRHRYASAPHTQVRPIPRATTAAWAGLTAPAGQHPICGDHAFQVVRVGLPAHQDHRLPRRVPRHRRRGIEHRDTHRRTRRRRHTPWPARSDQWTGRTEETSAGPTARR